MSKHLSNDSQKSCSTRTEHEAFVLTVWTPFDRAVKAVFVISVLLSVPIIMTGFPTWIPMQIFVVLTGVASVAVLIFLYRWSYIAIHFRHTPGGYSGSIGPNVLAPCSKGGAALRHGIMVFCLTTVYFLFLIFAVWSTMRFVVVYGLLI